MRDPIRTEVKNTIQVAQESGIRVIMITGDHIQTASAIGKELGLSTQKQPFAIEGDVFMSQNKETKKQTLNTTNIFARVTAETKLEIVELLQEEREVVTMIGDGINDTLALKKSEVGVSMGHGGTDAARMASSIVLTDNNFNTIIQAIFRGRFVFKNIQDVTNFLLSTNTSEALLIIITSAMGMPLPLVATQILLINLITDGIGSLPFAFRETKHTQIIKKNKKGKLKLLSKYDYGIILSAALGMTAASLFGFIYFLPKGLPYAQTLVFIILALTQIGRLVSLHSFTSIRELFQYKWLWLCVGISLAIIGLILYTPLLQNAFNFIAPKGFDILFAFILSLTPILTITMFKYLYKIRK
jgi:Ca2+-transporting ATPase